MKDSENIIVKPTFEFALAIIAYCEELESNKKFVVSNQLLKSGTSIGANVREAQNAESKNDFIHKFKIAAKEVEETIYWLELCKQSPNYPDCSTLIYQIETIQKLLIR
ncbi:four helix bundle protein [Flavobacterium agricola]|uniref:Four helix bundle protein n=1 Tax=Flavobacterium agricola TaxID=2870839 RepID=A0ABY6LXH4_9FLAO|nr:four helix bundle protein [Flavobacterium agricola]UYW01038.1 four helix bundle protein [Flavobacterium agricola]